MRTRAACGTAIVHILYLQHRLWFSFADATCLHAAKVGQSALLGVHQLSRLVTLDVWTPGHNLRCFALVDWGTSCAM